MLIMESVFAPKSRSTEENCGNTNKMKNISTHDAASQNECGIMQSIRNLSAQRFRPHSFVREHLEDVGELARGLADLHQRYIDRREIGGMLRDRLGKTFAGQNPARILFTIGRNRPISLSSASNSSAVVKAGAGLEKQARGRG